MNGRNKKVGPKGASAGESGLITTSVSLPKAMFDGVEENRAADDPEWNFSKYVRGLIRKDLALAKVAAKKLDAEPAEARS